MASIGIGIGIENPKFSSIGIGIGIEKLILQVLELVLVLGKPDEGLKYRVE